MKHSATGGECFTVVSFVEHFRAYLWGMPFTVEVDHWCFKWLMTSTQQNSRLAGLALKLQRLFYRLVLQLVYWLWRLRLPQADNDAQIAYAEDDQEHFRPFGL